ncbi:MAG: hypothetical protein JOY78_05140 [Pseudonocardia sp.]|nr:hypothetical protein [Pseudonocardia sp.]
MSPRTVVLACFAAAATLGLSACGAVDGSAHSVAPAAATATSSTAPTAPPTSVTPAPAVAAPAPANPAPVNAPGGPGGGANSGGNGNPAPSAPEPKIASFRVVQQPTCPVHGTPDAPFSKPGTDVVIAWSITGATGAAIAVDNPDVYGAYGGDYPASGKLSLSFGCDGQGTTTHSYTVWPAGAHDVSRTITVSAHSDG